MDILCPVCQEPWDNESLHDLVDDGAFRNYAQAARTFMAKGCGVAFKSWGVKCEPVNNARAAMIQATYEMLGDDTDGAMSMLEDIDLFD